MRLLRYLGATLEELEELEEVAQDIKGWGRALCTLHCPPGRKNLLRIRNEYLPQ
jgi:hypothetical protein